MANGNITVEVRLPAQTAAALQSIAKLAVVSVATVMKVLLAAEAARHQPPKSATP